MTGDIMNLNRRAFGGAMLGVCAAAACRVDVAEAAVAAEVAVDNMAAALQSHNAFSFAVDMTFGASVAKSRLFTLGNRAVVNFRRPGDLLAVYYAGGPDVHLLIQGGEAILFRPSLAAKSVVKIGTDGGSAFDAAGLFLPFMGLLSASVKAALFGDIQSVTPVAQGTPQQPDLTTLDSVMAQRFTGEIWTAKTTGLPTRMVGTYFDGAGGVAASAAASYSSWTVDSLPATDFDVKALDQLKTVSLAEMEL